jgi:tellurite resistance protein
MVSKQKEFIMDKQKMVRGSWNNTGWMWDMYNYTVDAVQRSILFTDIIRKRGNMYLEHVAAGQPPVLVFDYEMVMDGRTLERPVNYAMVKIVDPDETPSERKDSGSNGFDGTHRPIVVIDPRAGHGPGIGGSKFDSEIGVALKEGHPVYYVMFFTEPEPGQTLEAVQQAEVRFLEEVIKRHPEAEPPAVIGNCQAGWATALIGADRPDVTGPMVFNGSPLSYWGGVDGANPMRYKGGLYGGAWMTSLWCDLGNGKFDGASLVAGFEDLNPANTLWSKQYNVYANVDTEEKRYLNFEKWWGGFFKMNREEIHFIVESLFVGNELEQGKLKLGKDHWVNLKNFRDPIVVFASAGDNITPPQQALNWIYKVYKTVDEIRRNGQVIVYIVHPRIGHLGIFVGSKIARKEHTAIIGTVDMIDYLSPGLYEMVITDEAGPDGSYDRKVEFVERDMADILELDDGQEDEKAFSGVSAVSRFNDKLYTTFFSPLIRTMVTDTTAEMIRQLHPLRVQRYMFSDRNPWMLPFGYLAPWVRENRRPLLKDNSFMQWEKQLSDTVTNSLNIYRDFRDGCLGTAFKLLYENPWMKALFSEEEDSKETVSQAIDPIDETLKSELWRKTMEAGGFEAAVIRIVLAVSAADGSIDQREYLVAHQMIHQNERLSGLKPAQLKRLVKEQAAIVEYDKDAAIDTLPKLLRLKADRAKAFDIANSIATADKKIDKREEELLDRIKSVLKL